MDARTVTLTADQVLRVFHHDEIYLFLGAAFATVGLVSAAISCFGRKFDPLLLWLAIFAFLYGNRLWLQTGLLALMVPDSVFFRSLRDSANYLVPIPAFFYFRTAGYLGRFGDMLVYPFAGVMACLVVGVSTVGPLPIFRHVNNVTVVVALLVLAAYFLRHRQRGKEFRVIRFGLLAFVALALWDNTGGTWIGTARLEPFGFLIFLCALGYVAARRNLDRDSQLAAVQKELEVAEEIQRSILPVGFPDSPYFRVAARYAPMRSVAGDFYDFLPTGEREAGLLIADVSGHGVPAALIASMVKLAAASQRANAADPAAFLAGMNSVLCGNTQSQFVTAAYVHLNAASAEMRYAAAAHPPMLLLREGQVMEIAENGLMLGAFDTASYAMVVHPLRSGDRLLLYTDGVVEAGNASREEFGQERLCAVLRETEKLSHDAAADLILTRARQWSTAQEDDLTLLVCDYRRA
ncbi:MAG TPA: PP2C family protein-serine/threonine phosphatase [Acidobacteriaceae bacterium]|nr:PP2C family protein-serine/threonine phosphatase [Acidobacteriaceae bacterium]